MPFEALKKPGILLAFWQHFLRLLLKQSPSSQSKKALKTEQFRGGSSGSFLGSGRRAGAAMTLEAAQKLCDADEECGGEAVESGGVL